MRNRTELVTTTIPGSENEEEPSDLDDSEEDWKPEKKKGAAGKVSKPGAKTPAKRKSAGAAGKGAKKTPAKKVKKEESDEEEEEDEEDEEEEEELDDEDEEEAADDGSSKGGKGKTNNDTTEKPNRKAAANNIKSFPDKDGKFELYLFKDDLAKDFRNDPKLCMWRRDGSSLLQKYIKVKEEDNKEDVLFAASSVYSCWEEKRKHDFHQIKVQCIGDKKDGKVKVVDVEELARFAAEDRPKVEPKPAEQAAGGENDDDEEEGGDEEEDEEDGEEDEVEEEE